MGDGAIECLATAVDPGTTPDVAAGVEDISEDGSPDAHAPTMVTPTTAAVTNRTKEERRRDEGRGDGVARSVMIGVEYAAKSTMEPRPVDRCTPAGR